MPGMPSFSSLRVRLITDDPAVEQAVRMGLAPPHEVAADSAARLLDAKGHLTAHGQAAVQAMTEADVILLDWSFDQAPRFGMLCAQVRGRAAVPCYALVQGGDEMQVAALATGADGVLTFPLRLAHVRAQVMAYHRLVQAAQARARATTPQAAQEVSGQSLACGPLRIDRAHHRFYANGHEVELTPREFDLIAYLMEHPGTLHTRDQILDHVWGLDFDTGTNMVDVYMYFLRRKLGAHDLAGMIQTVRGRGYRLTHPTPAQM